MVFFDALTPKQSDYTAMLTKLKGTNPDLVFFTGYYSEAGLLLKQEKQMDWKVPFMGGDATNNPDLVKLAGKDAVTGFSFVMPPVPSIPALEAGESLPGCLQEEVWPRAHVTYVDPGR